jgi:hypothetical protein
VPTRTDAMKPSGCVVIDTTVQPKAVMFPIDRSFSRCRRSSGMCCACLEPVIDHIKEDHLMGRNYLAHANGDGIMPCLHPRATTSVGHNFRCLLACLLLLLTILTHSAWAPSSNWPNSSFHGRLSSHKSRQSRLAMSASTVRRCIPSAAPEASPGAGDATVISPADD